MGDDNKTGARPADEPAADENQIIAERRGKLNALRDARPRVSQRLPPRRARRRPARAVRFAGQ